jgi:hypothetical protein
MERQMRRVGLLVVFGLPVFAGTAHGATDVLTGVGKCSKRTNWSMRAKPSAGTPVVVPAGRSCRLEGNKGVWGSTVIEGSVSGSGRLRVDGDFRMAGPEEFEVNGTLDLGGMGTVDFGGGDVYYLESEGYESFASAINVVGAWNPRRGSTTVTNGWPVTVGGEAYPREGSVTLLGASTVTVGEWLVFDAPLMEMDATEATIVVDAHAPNRGLMRGGSWTYGNVTLEGASPESRTSYAVNGTLALNRPTEGVVQLEAGKTITAAALTTNGTEAEPVQVVSSEPGALAYIHCGCTVPPGLALTDVVVY